MSGLVSVIIVNWNGKHWLPGCLSTLQAQTYPELEIILVDNGSKDGSVEYVRSAFPQVKLIECDRNHGFALGNHIGYRASTGDLLFLLNNDTELHPEAVARLVEAARPERVAGTCGKIFSLSEKEKCIFTLPKIHPVTGRAIWINDDSPETPVDYLSGNSMLLKRNVVEQVGFLDPTYFAYFEETDLCARIIRAGYDLVYVPTATVWHKERGSAPPWFNRYYMTRNHLRFVLKNFDLRYLPRALAGAVGQMVREFKEPGPWDWQGNPPPAGLREPSWRLLLLQALGWNLLHLPHTLYSRYRDLSRLGGAARSYNENLPLRFTRC